MGWFFDGVRRRRIHKQAFNFIGYDDEADKYGRRRICEYWEGPFPPFPGVLLVIGLDGEALVGWIEK